jgi:hypothetical protein
MLAQGRSGDAAESRLPVTVAAASVRHTHCVNRRVPSRVPLLPQSGIACSVGGAAPSLLDVNAVSVTTTRRPGS